jgi:hypothetical protein
MYMQMILASIGLVVAIFAVIVLLLMLWNNERIK